MPVKELENFRAKYPMYHDIPDGELVQKLVSKHPEYADIASKVGPPSMQNESPWQMLEYHPFKTLLDTPKALTGKSMEERATEYSQGKNVGQNTERPFDKNLGQVMPGALGLNIGGQLADTALSPGTYIGGKLIEGASGLLPKVLPKVGEALKASAEKSYGKVLGPTTKSEKELAQRVIPGLLEKKPISFSRASLQRKSEQGLENVEDELDNSWKSLPKGTRVNVDPIINSIKTKQNTLLINGKLPDANSAEFNALTGMKRDLIKTVGEGNADPSLLRQYRQVLDQAVADSKKGFGLDAKGTAKIKAQRYLGNSIRQELASKLPDIAKINKQFSFWKNMTDLLETTTPKAKGALSATHAFGAVSDATGHPYVGMFANLGKLVNDNVLWNSISAASKSHLSDLISKADEPLTNEFITKLMTRGPKLNSERGSTGLNENFDQNGKLIKDIGNKGQAESDISKIPMGIMAGAGAMGVASRISQKQSERAKGEPNSQSNKNNEIDMEKINQIESSNNPNSVSNKGAVGLEQITQPALTDYNNKFRTHYKLSDMKNPKINKMVGKWYMNVRTPELLRSKGLKDSKENRLSSYNEGAGSLHKNIKNHKKQPKETRDYIKKYES